ncbi:tetratricopeptide repeat protein [Hydrogenovibrio kuenenii]|uniref:tetratricopeptide repeat protein n=1 Tax=Hydrogenovibrio kuenenii TaxID=63658 RepID=UPI000463C70D|nr:tetratricopeptide repeat protein [Hydrogenovibrio kuenenii]
MSVLLEALKKAAEEKKKQAGELNVEENAPQDKALSRVEALVSDKVDQNTLLEPPAVEEYVVESTSKSIDAKPEAPIVPLVQTENETPSVAGSFPKPLIVEEGAIAEETRTNDFQDKSQEQKDVSNVIDDSQDEDKNELRLEDSAQAAPLTVDDLETRLAVSSMDVPEVASSEKKPESVVFDEVQATPPVEDEAPETAALAEKKEAFQEENDWSLEQIPGYQNYGVTKTQQEKTRLILPHFSHKKTQSPKKWRLYLMGSVLVILGFAYYAMIYFDQQAAAIDKDMQHYQTSNQSEPSFLVSSEKEILAEKKEEQSQEPKTEVVDSSTAEQNEALKPKAMNNEVDTKKVIKQKTTKIPKAETSEHHTRAKNIASAQTKNLKIASQTQVSKVSLAYKAYQKNDWRKAETYYQQAYKEEPGNVAALFGLGAVSIKQGEKNRALAYYQQVLKLEPNNQLAQKAILGIKSAENAGQQTLDDLKQMAEINPEDSTVTFALGNIYAKRKDWVSAQSYYFKAYQHQPNQAIYALNLAVSLDQLGEYRLAKRYYKEALVKSPVNSPLFDTDSVKKRVLVIKQFLSKEK